MNASTVVPLRLSEHAPVRMRRGGSRSQDTEIMPEYCDRISDGRSYDLATREVPRARYSLTKHAARRSRQRNVTTEAISAALIYGQPYNVGRGCTAVLVTKKSISRAWRDGIRIERYRGIAVIDASDGDIVTVMRAPSVPARWAVAR